MSIVGIDGCKGGWLAVVQRQGTEIPLVQVFGTFGEILSVFPDLEAVAVDMPIGLLDDGAPGRGCDREAKGLLGRRHPSVFPVPARRVMDAPNYMEANALSKKLYSKGVMRQAFGIGCRIREVEQVVHKYGQELVLEIHPEVCFWAMVGAPARHSKHSREGLQERRALLVAHFGEEAVTTCESSLGSVRAKLDDLYDAMAALWSAERIVNGTAITIPENPVKDSTGLRMEINY